MKSDKAAGPDGIPAEAMTTDISTLVEMIYPLFGNILEEEMPEDWKEG